MSQTNVDLFYAKLNADPAALSALTSGATSPADLVERAVAAGQAQGLPFTAAEAESWLAQQYAVSDDGELSDLQLEGVAGGKGGGWDSFKKGWGEAMQDAFGPPIPAGSTRYRP